MPRPRGSNSRTISLLAICIGVSSACFFANLPLVPRVLRERDPEQLHLVGLLVSISFIISALMSPVWGLLANRFGPRIMMQRAAILVAVAYIAMAFAPTFEFMLAARIINGFANGLIPAAYTYAVKALPTEVQGRGFTTLSAASSAGAIIGPAVTVFAGFLGTTGVMVAVGGVAATTAIIASFLPRVAGKIVGRSADSEQDAATAATASRASPRCLRMVLQVVMLSLSVLSVLVLGAISSRLQTALPLSIAEADPDASYLIAGSMFAIGGAATRSSAESTLE